MTDEEIDRLVSVLISAQEPTNLPRLEHCLYDVGCKLDTFDVQRSVRRLVDAGRVHLTNRLEYVYCRDGDRSMVTVDAKSHAEVERKATVLDRLDRFLKDRSNYGLTLEVRWRGYGFFCYVAQMTTLDRHLDLSMVADVEGAREIDEILTELMDAREKQLTSDVPRTLFTTDGSGQWSRRTWVRPCAVKAFLPGPCQGADGHKGVHWCYGPDGTYHYDDNENDSTEDGCSGDTPPGHAEYVRPETTAPLCHSSCYRDEPVSDPAEIARLEAGEIGPGEMICSPVKWGGSDS